MSAKKQKRVMRKARLSEISLVDRPAQAHARITVLKRADDNDDVSKKYPMEQPVMLSDAEGHSHLLDLADGVAGETTYNKSEGAECGHTHPWLKTSEGVVTIGAADGHSHEILPQSTGALSKGVQPVVTTAADGGNQEIHMTPEEKAAMEKAAKDALAVMEKRAQRAEAIAVLTDAQKALFAKMDEKAQDAFLALSPQAREIEVSKASDSDPIVYKSLSGREFRKSADPMLVEMAKALDEERNLRMETERVAKRERLEKRAQELPSLAADINTKVALLEAIESLPVEKRKLAEDMLAKADAAVKVALTTKGVEGEPVTKSGQKMLDEMAAQIKDKNPSMTIEQAMNKALETPEGQKAYFQDRS